MSYRKKNKPVSFANRSLGYISKLIKQLTPNTDIFHRILQSVIG